MNNAGMGRCTLVIASNLISQDKSRFPAKKVDLINRFNPDWKDVYDELH